jgi:hypothetical protein
MVEAFYMQSVLGGREFSVMSHPKKRWVILCKLNPHTTITLHVPECTYPASSTQHSNSLSKRKCSGAGETEQ